MFAVTFPRPITAVAIVGSFGRGSRGCSITAGSRSRFLGSSRLSTRPARVVGFRSTGAFLAVCAALALTFGNRGSIALAFLQFAVPLETRKSKLETSTRFHALEQAEEQGARHRVDVLPAQAGVFAEEGVEEQVLGLGAPVGLPGDAGEEQGQVALSLFISRPLFFPSPTP